MVFNILTQNSGCVKEKGQDFRSYGDLIFVFLFNLE